MNTQDQTQAYREAGSGSSSHKRPLEILEFVICNEERGELVEKSFAINVVRVREIMKHPQITKMLDTDPCVKGLFRLRESLIPLVDLPQWLGLSDKPDDPGIVIVTELNETLTGFRVNSIRKIHHLSWDDVRIPDKVDKASSEFIAGIISQDGHLIMVLDFETILAKIGHQPIRQDISRFEPLYSAERDVCRILVVDDSAFSREYAAKVLRTVGYQVMTAANGVDALNMLANRDLDKPDFVLTDLEMPQMDGYELLERIGMDRDLPQVPGIVITSLKTAVGQHTQKQGLPVTMSKNDMLEVINAIDTELDVEPNRLTSQWDSY